MAKNRNKSHSRSSLSNQNIQRNIFNVAKPSRLLVPSPIVKSQFDGRLYKPAVTQKMQTDLRRLLYMRQSLVSNTSKNFTGSPLSRLKVKTDPLRRSICQSRHTRRSVLHALKKTGSGGGKKHRRRTWKSSVKC